MNLSNLVSIGGQGELGGESRPSQELVWTCSNFMVQEDR